MADKQCTKCGEIKPLELFVTDNRRTNGVGSSCKACDTASSVGRKLAIRAKAARWSWHSRLVDRWHSAKKRTGITLEEYAEHYELLQVTGTRDHWQSWWIGHNKQKSWLPSSHYRAIADAAGEPVPDPRRSTCFIYPSWWGDKEIYSWRYHNLPEFNASERLRRQITKSARCETAMKALRSILSGGTSRVRETIGCGPRTFYRHMLKQMPKDMTADDLSTSAVHIDHIRGRALFDLSDPEQWKECWHYTNLRPLWAQDNLRRPKDCSDVLL